MNFLSKSEKLDGKIGVGSVFQRRTKKTHIEQKCKSLSTRSKKRKNRKKK